MGFDVDELAEASAAQLAAATDPSPHVRVIAGPGTGKSQTVEQRVCWLLEQGIAADRIVGVSFTRAASADLSARVGKAWRAAGYEDGVQVGTLHSFALRALRAAGRLGAYPADPVVLQKWEVENVFDAEFAEAIGRAKERRRDIREDAEAFWQTGEHSPPQATPPDPPISEAERQTFRSFHGPRTQLYSCVLPGEIVGLCVEHMAAGTLDVAALLNVEHLIVDEFQDLNPMDLRLVHMLAECGVSIFAAGDDDQSLYAFRYATPAGIERFTELRPDAGDHTLSHCFRCVPPVLDAAQTLIRRNASDGRIEKNLTSMYAKADPAVRGGLGCWRFSYDRIEAAAIAESCSKLIRAGIKAREIMILLASKRLGSLLHQALDAAQVPYAPIREEDITDTPPGRAAYAMLAIVCEPDNYVAHRTVLGIRRGVGVRTCHEIANAVIANQRNFRELFYDPVPDGLLTPRQIKAVRAAADICADLTRWSKDETIGERLDDLLTLVGAIRGGDATAADEVGSFLAELPSDMTLQETLTYLGAGRDDDRRKVLDAYAIRTGSEIEIEELVPNRVSITTMHSAKGLSATVVFIPALEEEVLPGTKRALYPGQVLEAARMLYVSITRARVACIVSYAENRFGFGHMESTTASRFTAQLGKRFDYKTAGMSQAAVEAVAECPYQIHTRLSAIARIVVRAQGVQTRPAWLSACVPQRHHDAGLLGHTLPGLPLGRLEHRSVARLHLGSPARRALAASVISWTYTPRVSRSSCGARAATTLRRRPARAPPRRTAARQRADGLGARSGHVPHSEIR
jgi:DNA helicase-2/ATP-dependent DNA helicase PcrA